jgi:hypothetical protein
MQIYEDSVRDRLNEIADELAVIAASASMPSDRDFAEALAAEVRRIERSASRGSGGRPGR